MTTHRILILLFAGFALACCSCSLLHRDNDPQPEKKSWVKGIIKYQPKYVPDVICDTPCDWTQPLQTTLYFVKKEPYYSNKIPTIIDSTTSNERGEFSKQLAPGSYSLLVTFRGVKYVSPIWMQNAMEPPYAFSFEVMIHRTTVVNPIVVELKDE
jgi:hypothetical protein